MTCLRTPNFESSDAENNKFAFLGTSTGSLFFYNLEKRTFLNHCVPRNMIFSKDVFLSDIRVNPVKPHRILLVYKEKAFAVYSANKHEFLN